MIYDTSIKRRRNERFIPWLKRILEETPPKGVAMPESAGVDWRSNNIDELPSGYRLRENFVALLDCISRLCAKAQYKTAYRHPDDWYILVNIIESGIPCYEYLRCMHNIIMDVNRLIERLEDVETESIIFELKAKRNIQIDGYLGLWRYIRSRYKDAAHGLALIDMRDTVLPYYFKWDRTVVTGPEQEDWFPA